MVEPISIRQLPTFDMAEQLRDEDDIADYLSLVLEEGDSDEFIRALGHIAKARGMTRIARDSGLGRESLYKALREGAQPRFDTIQKILKALNIELRASTRDHSPKVSLNESVGPRQPIILEVEALK